MKAKHTPGPWHYVDYAASFVIQDGPYYEDPSILCYDDEFGIGDFKRAEANAKLAAAAPNLLEALESLMKGVQSLPPLSAIAGVLEKQYKQAEATIKKATE